MSMGTWGPGNFQNDGAHDWLGMMQRGLEQQIEEILNHRPTSPGEYPLADLDELGESRLMPMVAVVALLHESFGGPLPGLGAIRRWRELYLAVYDEQIDRLGATLEFKRERRRVIAETFARLERLAQGEAGGSA
jgi:hypothetical protein